MANRFEAAVAKAAPVATRVFPLGSVFVGSDKPVILHCRHAGFSNPVTSSAMLKAASERRRIRAIKDDQERFEASARLDAKTLAGAVVSWDNVGLLDEETQQPLAPSPANVEELLLAIVAKHMDLFQRWKMWVGDEDNFVEMPTGDPADLGK